MTPVYQTRFGKDGNCWAACLASILDLPLEATDHCACHHEGWEDRTDELLAARGLFLAEYVFPPGGPAVYPPKGTYLICGMQGTPERHVVIGQVRRSTKSRGTKPGKFQIEIVHEPMRPDFDTSEHELESFFLLCAIDPTKWGRHGD